MRRDVTALLMIKLALAFSLVTSNAHAECWTKQHCSADHYGCDSVVDTEGHMCLEPRGMDCSKPAKSDRIVCFYATDFVGALDRYAHPRSVAEYRRLVPHDDMYGMCRSAGHVRECLDQLHVIDAEGP